MVLKSQNKECTIQNHVFQLGIIEIKTNFYVITSQHVYVHTLVKSSKLQKTCIEKNVLHIFMEIFFDA